MHRKINLLHTKKVHIKARKVRGYIVHRLNLLLGTKLGFFLVRSTFSLAHAFGRSVPERLRSRL